jgi:GNAT superfamily N-acetyltransferase
MRAVALKHTDLTDFVLHHALRAARAVIEQADHVQLSERDSFGFGWGGAKTFVAIDDADKTILGFYGLSPASVDYARTPEIVRRGLARHDVPGFRLARLAVDRRWQGQGVGGPLLLAAGRRCLLAAAEVGGVVLVSDAKNERVAGWYASYGAVPLLNMPFLSHV